MKKKGREFLKDSARLRYDFSRTPQSRGLPPPPAEKPCPEGSGTVELVPRERWKGIAPVSVEEAVAARRSHRHYTGEPLGLDEVSFLLWATQGVRRYHSPAAVFRTVPSAGCRHAFETYLCALDVEGLEKGVIYRYLPLSHRLCRVRALPDLPRRLAEGTLGQRFTGRGAATFVWTAVPERMEWRYGEVSYKVIALDAGHLCQSLYLACAAVGAGTCAVGAYHQELMDGLLGVDGEEEFTVYLAPVGKVAGPGEEED